MNRPRCKFCSKPLVKATYIFEKRDLSAPDPTVYFNRPILGITRRKRGHVGTSNEIEHLWIWLGEYGDRADSHFCNKTCGYKWAVAHASKVK